MRIYHVINEEAGFIFRIQNTRCDPISPRLRSEKGMDYLEGLMYLNSVDNHSATEGLT